ncbi:helix-turn-helix transcriptional regulator [Burkholderia cepacia]|uniref:helix-turn-helix transcriptional regulator n=1 Tax=Burkholderia cepacia TaxID=292 RepID=UPI003453CC28
MTRLTDRHKTIPYFKRVLVSSDTWGRSRGELKQFVPLCLSSVTNRERAGRFPKRVKLGSYSVAWPNREIHRWFADPNGYRAQHTDEVTA